MKFGFKELSEIYSKYSEGKALRDSITVEIDAINTLDPLVLLRAMSKELDVVEFAPIVETAINGHTVSFIHNDKVLKTVAYNKGSGNALHLMFTDTPYLYDLLQQTVHALLLKKLTPHLEDSN